MFEALEDACLFERATPWTGHLFNQLVKFIDLLFAFSMHLNKEQDYQADCFMQLQFFIHSVELGQVMANHAVRVYVFLSTYRTPIYDERDSDIARYSGCTGLQQNIFKPTDLIQRRKMARDLSVSCMICSRRSGPKS